MSDFAPPASKLAESGIGVAAAPTGGMGLALDDKGEISPSLIAFSENSAACSGDVTLTTSAQDVTGCSLTLALPGWYLAWGIFDMDHTAAGAGVALGTCVVGSTTQGPNVIVSESAGRVTTGHIWLFQTTEGRTIAKLQASKSMNAGTAIVRQTHTVLTALRIG